MWNIIFTVHSARIMQSVNDTILTRLDAGVFNMFPMPTLKRRPVCSLVRVNNQSRTSWG